MKLMVCVDDDGGMSFFGRRQSMDRKLRLRALALAGEEGLWMSPYSREQFTEEHPWVKVDPDFPHNVPDHGWCFLEITDPVPLLDRAQTLALFRWNRRYPSDRKFPLSLLDERWRRVCLEDFPGYSHEIITLEVYVNDGKAKEAFV